MSKFKVGDKVMVKDSSYSVLLNKAGDFYQSRYDKFVVIKTGINVPAIDYNKNIIENIVNDTLIVADNTDIIAIQEKYLRLEIDLVEKNAIKKTRDSICNSIDTIINMLYMAKKSIMYSEDIDTLMINKRNLLLSTIQLLPLSASSCVYCNVYKSECSKCRYGLLHGQCSDPESTYYKIQEEKKRMLDVLSGYYP